MLPYVGSASDYPFVSGKVEKVISHFWLLSVHRNTWNHNILILTVYPYLVIEIERKIKTEIENENESEKGFKWNNWNGSHLSDNLQIIGFLQVFIAQNNCQFSSICRRIRNFLPFRRIKMW